MKFKYKIFWLSFLMVGFQIAQSQPSTFDPKTKFGFYTINRATRNLVFVDSSGNVNIIGPTGIDAKYLKASVGSLEFDKLGNLWFSGQNDSLYTINRKTGQATFKVKLQHAYLTVTNGIYFNALSFNSKNEMYSWLEPIGPPLGRLIKVTDLNTGATSALTGGTSSDIPEVNAIDFGDNDTLWSLDQCCYRKLHILNTATGLSISKSVNVLNIENVSDMDYSFGNIYGMNIVGYNSATSTGFFKTTRNGTPKSLFSLPGQYVGMAGFNQVVYTDTNYVCQTTTVTGNPTKFGFYTIKQSTKDLYFVDTLGTFTKIGNTNLKTIGKYRGLDIDANNNLYLLGDLDSLYKISASSGKATFVSKLNQPGLTNPRGPSISFAPNGQLYILDELAAFPEGTLRKVVNIATGLTTTVGTSTTGLPSVLAIDFDNLGTLWATDECCDLKLHKLNTVSGISTFSASQTLNNSFPSELDHSNGKLYGISIENETSSNATYFYSINKNTGAATTLFTTTGIYVGLAGRNKPIYTDTTYLTQVVTVTAFQTVTVTSTQTLTVTSIVTIHDCGTVTGGNLGGRSDAASISVYPNPSSSKISVTSNGQIVFSADVLDSRGISIFSTYYPNSIDVAEWPKGVYLLRAKDEEGNVLKTFKILKE